MRTNSLLTIAMLMMVTVPSAWAAESFDQAGLAESIRSSSTSLFRAPANSVSAGTPLLLAAKT